MKSNEFFIMIYIFILHNVLLQIGMSLKSKHKAKRKIKLSIHIPKIHSIHEVTIGRIHKCAICEVDQRLKPMVRNNWYIEKDLYQHIKMIHEAHNNDITFSWQGFFET